MNKFALLAIATLVALPLAAQDSSKIVYYNAQQMKANLDKAPANDMGESEINLFEHTPQQGRDPHQ
jgi:hypothetical protein